MADRSNESVSALMDGEIADFELRRTLERIEAEPELTKMWQRYHLVRSVMRNEEVGKPDLDISSLVMSALDDEPEFSTSDAHMPKHDDEKSAQGTESQFWKPLASMAAAASVTAMVILGVQNTNREDVTIADNRPAYTLPANTISNDFVRARFGAQGVIAENGQEPEIIRLSQGIERYIDQHKHMLGNQQSSWKASWLPKGFKGLKRDVMAHAEVQVFSNGRNSFTVCVEDYGHQTVPEGVAESGNIVAVGKRMGDQFVTVVGDVPLMIAERIASSVEPR